MCRCSHSQLARPCAERPSSDCVLADMQAAARHRGERSLPGAARCSSVIERGKHSARAVCPRFASRRPCSFRPLAVADFTSFRHHP
eukprot:2468003-Prymnesium_polylepis.1